LPKTFASPGNQPSYLAGETEKSLLTAITSLAATAKNQALPTFPDAVDTHKAMVYSIAWHFLHDRQAAEELAQDVFLQLHKNWAAIQSPEHLLFWLRRTSTHRAIDAARKRKSKAETSLEDSDEPTVLERVHDSLLASFLSRMVGTLPEKQRVAILLRYQEDMEVDEIAKLLEMHSSTVKTNIARGLEMLRGKVSRRLGKGEGKHDAI
jgi:RNA polymerase sigma-70 factor (ECF subfamily)